MNSIDKINELKTVQQTLRSFLNYTQYVEQEYYAPRVKKWDSLPNAQKELIPWYSTYLDEIKQCIEINGSFFLALAQFGAELWDLNLEEVESWPIPSCMDMSKTVSMLSQVAREWSEDCADERKFLPSKVSMVYQRSSEMTNKTEFKILNPGTGTGRFVAEMARQGYTCEGNEYSYHMLIMSMYILNGGHKPNSLRIYPFIHTFSHWQDKESQLKLITVPDISLQSVIQDGSLMSISAGSFIDCYGPNIGIQASNNYSTEQAMVITRAEAESSKDLVVTNFFIDTGPNILEYLAAICHVLKPNGHWINYGPLLYHFESDSQVESTTYEIDRFTGQHTNIHYNVPLKGLELTVSDILDIATTKLGFSVVEYQPNILTGYGKPPTHSALPGYMCHYWTLQWNPINI